MTALSLPREPAMSPAGERSLEIGRILDALAAVSVDLSCHCDAPPDRLVLSAAKVREACNAIDQAVGGLKRLLHDAEAEGGAAIAPEVLQRASAQQARGDGRA